MKNQKKKPPPKNNDKNQGLDNTSFVVKSTREMGRYKLTQLFDLVESSELFLAVSCPSPANLPMIPQPYSKLNLTR